jgi:hypothetical protein
MKHICGGEKSSFYSSEQKESNDFEIFSVDVWKKL